VRGTKIFFRLLEYRVNFKAVATVDYCVALIRTAYNKTLKCLANRPAALDMKNTSISDVKGILRPFFHTPYYYYF